MIAYTRGKFEHLLKIEFIRFCIVGGLGFVINFALLNGLKFLGLNVWFAQFIGAELALGSNFILHHTWTYKRHRVEKSIRSLIIQFHATSWPAIVGSIIMVGTGEKVFHLGNFEALAVSSVVVFAWNFVWSKFVVWRDMTPKKIEEIAK